MNKTNKNNNRGLNPKGFTLIELLVVIAIIAILAIVGLVLFSGQQKSARDAKRRGDIDAIVQALETEYNPNQGYYTTPAAGGGLTAAQFGANAVPTDPSNVAVTCPQTYIMKWVVGASTAIPANADPATWTTCIATPATWTTVAVGVPAVNVNFGTWTVCARLESSAAVYCRSNSR